MTRIFTLIMPYLVSFAGAFALTFVLTPIVRALNTRLGMVDKPDARRINKVPIPRGGGIALVTGVVVSYALFLLFTGRSPMGELILGAAQFWKMIALSVAIAALGYADDKFSLPPRLKLLGQVIVAFLVWLWADLGFHRLWPNINPIFDCAATVFWVVGAVNAFNLIDGLDGLASGLALIATLGMAGALFMVNGAAATPFYFAFAGGLVAFLKYNYNPASIFLGDSGSMFIGFILSVLPLATQTTNSFLVSIGMPLLAMGVPIFDTALAIIRRSIRRVLRKRDSSAESSSADVMTADADHLHHRILRAAKLNQRRAAWILYLTATFFVIVGLGGMLFESKAAGLWLFAVATASIVIFKDVSRVELFDAGRLLNFVARDRDRASRRRIARLAVPLYVTFDVVSLVAVFFLCQWALRLGIDRHVLRVVLPIRVISVFFCLCILNTYSTAWSRAMSSNYARILLACIFGSAIGSIAIYYAPGLDIHELKASTLLFATSSAVAIVIIRLARSLVRDLFYALDCNRLRARKDVSRILVYGSGLRYRAFRRELVRTASENTRIIVGLLDDDILLRGQYIGGVQIMGNLAHAPEIINALNVDAVVIACEVKPEWMKIILQTLRPTGVKISHFTFSEKEIQEQ